MTLAIIAAIKVRKHPNADRVQLGDVLGYQVVVGMDVKDGDTGIFFREGLQLSVDFVKENKLSRADGGYFEDNRRVRCQKFRGEKSEGFWIPYSGKPGTRLDTLDGKVICTKYITPETWASRKKGSTNRRETTMFKCHFETDQWRLNSAKYEGRYAIATLKLHGTSQRTGYVKDDGEWKYLVGSRNVILERKVQPTYWQGWLQRFGLFKPKTEIHGEQFRMEAAKPFIGQLRKGETVYYEIVGYDGLKPIMRPAKAVGDIKQQYGKSDVVFHYGQEPGTFGVYVYRITMTNEDGDTVEYSWEDVKLRCRELMVNHVPELNDGYIGVMDLSNDGPDPLGKVHPMEGICIRVGNEVFKHKSFTFGVLEGYLKDDSSYVDIEESA